MSSREKTLAAIVASLILLVISYLLLTQFQQSLNRFQGQLRSKEDQLKIMQTLIAERDMWAQRDAWIKAQQPKLTNEVGEPAVLIDKAKEISQKYSITVENPQFGLPERRPNYVAISVTMEAKGKWENIIDFLYDMQDPAEFRVFDQCDLMLDSTDKSQVRGKLRLSKWFAPKS